MAKTRKPFTFAALAKITRFWNLVIIAFAQFFTAYWLVGFYTVLNWKLYVLSLSTILIAAAGYIINDYYDVKIDLINKPGRVVVGRGVRRRYALFFHSALSILGVALGLAVNWKIGLINFFSAFILWWYSNFLKRQPFIGNLAVSFLTALSVYVVAVIFDPFNVVIIIYCLFSFFVTLVREIIKDMEDQRGDNSFGCKTLPIVWGIRKTKNFIYLIVLANVVGLIWFNRSFAELPLWMMLAFIVLPIALLMFRLTKADTVKDFYQLSFYCKLIMFVGVLSMVFI